MPEINIVNVSGGVDSTATYLLALERGTPFRAVFADTGNEHEYTIEYINTLAAKTGGPEVQTIKADFSQKIEVRRMNLERQLETGVFRKGWTAEKAKRVLDNLNPTGIPFLDLCMWKGRFPGSKSRFCTIELKLTVLRRNSIEPAICEVITKGGLANDVITWVGIRRDESEDRKDAQEWETEDLGNRIYRPLVDWKKQECFTLLKRHGVEPNPLYKLGYGRVGCMPCINAKKEEVREITRRFPNHIDRIRYWEHKVSLCSKREVSTFFPADKTPGKEDTRSNIDAVVEWAKTSYGGRQYDLMAFEEAPVCSSMYGLCE